MMETSSTSILLEAASESESSEACSSTNTPDSIGPIHLCKQSQSRGTGRSLGLKSCGTIHRVMSGGTGTFRESTIVSNRHNVAIATQVISPSAIGGSLHRRRLVKHFGPVDTEDEEDDIFSRKRRMDWGKIACYGGSIVVTILLMTG